MLYGKPLDEWVEVTTVGSMQREFIHVATGERRLVPFDFMHYEDITRAVYSIGEKGPEIISPPFDVSKIHWNGYRLCAYCRSQISDALPTCPRCGAPYA